MYSDKAASKIPSEIGSDKAVAAMQTMTKENIANQPDLESFSEATNKNDKQNSLVEIPKNPFKRFLWELRKRFFSKAPTVNPAINEADKKVSKDLGNKSNEFDEWIRVEKTPTLDDISIKKKEDELEKDIEQSR